MTFLKLSIIVPIMAEGIGIPESEMYTSPKQREQVKGVRIMQALANDIEEIHFGDTEAKELAAKRAVANAIHLIFSSEDAKEGAQWFLSSATPEYKKPIAEVITWTLGFLVANRVRRAQQHPQL